MPRVTIVNLPATIDSDNRTILDAALIAGIPFPHGCRAGNCGSCRSRLVDGEVDVNPQESSYLEADEIAGGLILACQCRPRTNVTLRWLGEAGQVALPPRHLKAKVTARDALTHDIMRIRLGVSAATFPYLAGQFAELTFARLPARPYSMAGPSNSDGLEFHIRRVPGGRASGHVAEHLEIGERVRLHGPFGTAHLRFEPDRPILAVAGGSGLAPILSILGTAIGSGQHAPVHLYHGVRDERDVYGEDDFRRLAGLPGEFRATTVLSVPNRPTNRQTGMMHDIVAGDFACLDGFKVYLAGPPPMVEAVSAVAMSRGVPDADIHADPFVASPTFEMRSLGDHLRRFLKLPKPAMQRGG